MIRVSVSVGSDLAVTIATHGADDVVRTLTAHPVDAGAQPIAEWLPRDDDDVAWLPGPPADEAAHPRLAEDAAIGPWCGGEDFGPIVEALARVADHVSLDEVDARVVGRWLYEVLLGPHGHALPCLAADRAPAAVGGNGGAPRERVELALAFEAGGRSGALAALPWELMHDGRTFLSARTADRHPIALIRIADGPGAGPPAAGPPIDAWPVRMLVVVSDSMGAADLRPALEAMSLLARFHPTTPCRAQVSDDWLQFDTRIIERATLDEIRRVSEDFRPHAVHFIAHGGLDPVTGAGTIDLPTRDGGRDMQRHDASRLASALVGPGRGPAIAIVAACRSSQMIGSDQSASLAGGLVAHGIPVVVGMAGRISSPGCRILVRRVGEALVRGEPLATAVAEARAALLSATNEAEHASRPEWALPTLFLDRASPVDGPTLTPAAIARREIVEQRLRRLPRQAIEPVLCGVPHLEQRMDELLTPGGHACLCWERPLSIRRAGEDRDIQLGDAQVGKTRVLVECARWAVRNGHVPVLVPVHTSASPHGRDRPLTLLDLARQFVEAIENAARWMGVPIVPAVRCAELLAVPGDPPPPPEAFTVHRDFRRWSRDILQRHDEDRADHEATPARRLDRDDLRDALAEDANRLRDAVIAADAGLDEGCRVVVLFDDAHSLQNEFRDLRRNLYDGGFADGGPAIPLVAAYDQTEAVPLWSKDSDRNGMVRAEILAPLPADGEAAARAYTRALLHPFSDEVNPVPIRVADTDDATRALVEQQLCRLADGFVSRLAQPEMVTGIETLRGVQLLVDADDEAILDQYVTGGGGPGGPGGTGR